MKRLVLLVLIFCSVNIFALGQHFQKPSEGKSIVYFVLASVDLSQEEPQVVMPNDFYLEDWHFNMEFFDGDHFLGKRQYGFMYYECDPGEHLFWIFNTSIGLLEAQLLADRTYLVCIPIPYFSSREYSYEEQIEIIGSYFNDLFELVPVDRDLDSFKFRGLKEYMMPFSENMAHTEMVEEIPSKRNKIKKITEMKRKAEILYQYRIKNNQTIPYLGPHMYIQINTENEKSLYSYFYNHCLSSFICTKT